MGFVQNYLDFFLKTPETSEKAPAAAAGCSQVTLENGVDEYSAHR